MLHNIKPLYLHCVFHGIRFKVNNEDWLSVKMAFFIFCQLDFPETIIFIFAFDKIHISNFSTIDIGLIDEGEVYFYDYIQGR